MRTLALSLLLVGCTDAADVPATVAHIHLTATCTTADCTPYSELFYDSCGPSGSTAIEPTTHDVEVLTASDAEDIAGYVQLQYTTDQVPTGHHGEVYIDQVLGEGEKVDVYAAYDYALLYRITAAGEIVDIDMTRLTAASDNMLQFQYTVGEMAAQEDHVIDAPRPVRVETDDPGLMDACCSVGRPQEAGLVLVALGFVVMRRRARRA
jgi:hypothetical protein